MKCKECGSLNLGIKDTGPHKELYCKDCLAFQKFLGKKKAERFIAMQAEQRVK